VMPAEPLPVRTTTADTSIIQYTNWEGIHKEFKIITGVVDDKGDYVRVRVSPTFKYITLKRTRIGNPEALFDATTTAPSREIAPTVESEAEPTVTPAPADTVNLILTGCGIATYDATHVLRDLRPDLGTFDLYGMLRNFPQTVAENMPLEQAEAFKKQLEDAGCTVELK
jgi:ribosomal protein L7/L12